MDRNALMAGYGIAEGVDPQYAQNYNDYARNALMKRATVLPLAEYADGSARLAVPGMIHDGIDAFWRIPQMAQDNEWKAAGYMGGAAGGAAMTGSLAASRPANSIGMGGKPAQPPAGGQITSMFTRRSMSPDQYVQNAQAIPALRKQVADADAAFRAHEATLVGPDGIYTAAGANDQRLRVLGDDLEMLRLRLAYAEKDPAFSNPLMRAY